MPRRSGVVAGRGGKEEARLALSAGGGGLACFCKTQRILSAFLSQHSLLPCLLGLPSFIKKKPRTTPQSWL